VIDAAGNAVATTYTLNTGYGAKFVVPGTGVLLNNEMDDFAVAPGKPNLFGLVQGEANKIEPGKRMLSSMTPTILVKDGEVRAVLGSPGGSTISTTVAQLTRALVDYQVPLDQAVPALRAHHQWKPDGILIDAELPPEVRAKLEAMGHKLNSRGRIGHANCIEVDPKTRGFRAVADTTRTGGKAAAY
jgi:gamma-glutamyltranspeptidase/glutathione hydrolase